MRPVSSGRVPGTYLRAAALCALLLVAAPCAWADWMSDVGYTQLSAELGSSLPTGAGVGVAQIEARDANYNYMVDTDPVTSYGWFAGKTITRRSANSGVSSHATYVGEFFYGNGTSLAPGVTIVDVYEANNWLNSKVKMGTPYEPVATVDAQGKPQRVQNYSWIYTSDTATDTDVLRRFDYMLQQNNIFAAVGTSNGATTPMPTVLAGSYNAMVVGLSSGAHGHGLTQIDQPGRIKPDIVAPYSYTSFATPMVAGAAAMLYSAADADPNLVNARTHPELIKAILMAGATRSKFATWDRTTTRPLDDQFGAGELNIYNSYHLLKAGPFAASLSGSVGRTGWDYSSVSPGSSELYFFDVTGNVTDQFSVMLNWNRQVYNGTPGGDVWTPAASVANLDLRLYRASGFALNGVVDASLSTVDNVECIYQTILPAGRYAMEVSSVSGSSSYALAWQSLLTVYAAGDFNQDAVVNAADIDLLYRNLGGGATYDLTADGKVDQADVTQLVRGVLGTNYGDLNLDRKVDFTDFQVVLNNWGLSGNWASGDVTGDRQVSFLDFQALLSYWNPAGSAQTVASGNVPEPASMMLMLGGILVLRRRL